MSFWTVAVTQTLINTMYTLSYLNSTIILWGRHCYPFLKIEKKKKKNRLRDYSWCYGTIHMVTSFILASGLKPYSPNCWEGFLAETSSRKDTWTKRNALPKAMFPPQGQLTSSDWNLWAMKAPPQSLNAGQYWCAISAPTYSQDRMRSLLQTHCSSISPSFQPCFPHPSPLINVFKSAVSKSPAC